MKRLILLRHAKAEADGAVRDVDRVLAGSGRSDMRLVSAELARASPRPEVALVSPAARTRETWDLAGRPEVPTRFDERIYEASPETLLAVVQGAPAEVGAAILVGHNPGIEELARQLVGGGDAAARLASGLPTAALVTLDLAVESWSEAAFGGARLVDLATPRSLGARDA